MATLSGVFAVLVMALALPSSAQTPEFIAQPGRIAAVVLPAAVLSDRDVHDQLGSGLTTTFLLTARQRGAGESGAAHIEIRFDLWDDVWLVRRIEFDGKEERLRIPSRQLLDQWWSTPVRFFGAAAGRVMLTVTLTVLPFSVAEGKDAREWMAKSAGASAAEPRSSPFVTALIGTTLNAKPIRSYRWTANISFP